MATNNGVVWRGGMATRLFCCAGGVRARWRGHVSMAISIGQAAARHEKRKMAAASSIVIIISQREQQGSVMQRKGEYQLA